MPTYDDLASAIVSLHMVSFTYDGKHRICEPHVLGNTNGQDQILTWQSSGGSVRGGLPQWRRFDLSGITNLKIMGRKFAGYREVPFPHSVWDTVYLTV